MYRIKFVIIVQIYILLYEYLYKGVRTIICVFTLTVVLNELKHD